MTLIEILAIALSLSMDAFSVCLASGAKLSQLNIYHYLRFSLSFGLFQFMMPLAGFYGGVALDSIISPFRSWAAFIILSLIGLNMIRESFKEGEDEIKASDPSKGLSLLVLSVATSIDAAATGLSFAALNVPILFPAIIIGITCVLISAVGLFLGGRMAGKISGEIACRIGGLVLIALGIKILVQSLI